MAKYVYSIFLRSIESSNDFKATSLMFVISPLQTPWPVLRHSTNLAKLVHLGSHHELVASVIQLSTDPVLLHECSGICVEESINHAEWSHFPWWLHAFLSLVLTTAWIPLYFPRPSINTCPTQLSQNFSFPLKPPTPTLPSYSQLHSLLTHVVIQPLGKLKSFAEKLPKFLTLHLLPYHSLCNLVLGFPTYYLKWSVLGFHLYWLYLDA